MNLVKKTLLAVTAVAALSTSAMAANTISNMSVGYSHINMGHNITGNGGVIGWNIAVPLNGSYMPIQNLEVGFGANVSFYGMSGLAANSNMVGASGKVTIGYRMLNDRLTAKAGIGYGYLSPDSNLDFTGMNYSTSVDYMVTPKLGVEGIYTYSTLTPSVGSGKYNTNKVGLNLLIKF